MNLSLHKVVASKKSSVLTTFMTVYRYLKSREWSFDYFATYVSLGTKRTDDDDDDDDDDDNDNDDDDVEGYEKDYFNDDDGDGGGDDDDCHYLF